MAPTPTVAAFARVAQIAADRRVHRAFQWMHLHEQQIMRWQTELTSIPAPPFGEGPRAEWLCARFSELGLEDVELDGIGNALGVKKSRQPTERGILISAHLDTVFPAATPIHPIVKGTRLEAPGACDNGAGLVCLLAIAAALQHADITPQCDVIFAGNVGEEGEGNLRGTRFLYEKSGFAERIGAHVVVDGAGHESVVTEALGSHRYQVTLRGPGGHSWADAAHPNPIVVLSQAIARLSAVELSASPRTTINGAAMPRCSKNPSVAATRRSIIEISLALSSVVSARRGPPSFAESSWLAVTGKPVFSRIRSRAAISWAGLRTAK